MARPSASAAPPKPVPKAAPGTPTLVLAASPRGGWIAKCEARSDTDGNGRIATWEAGTEPAGGDALYPYLVDENGDEHALDAWIGSADEGRHIAYVQDGKLWLRDTQTHALRNLSAEGADVRTPAHPYEPHRALTFGFGSAVFVKGRGTKTRSVVIDLSTGKSVTGASTPGEIFRTRRAGDWLLQSMLIDDTNGNGRLDWPRPTAKGRMPCPQPGTPFSEFLDRGDKLTLRAVPVDGKPGVVLNTLVAAAGQSLIFRDQDRVLKQWKNRRTREIAPKDCEAKVIAVHHPTEVALIACTKEPGRPPLELVGTGIHKELGIDLGTARLNTAIDVQRLLAVYPRGNPALVDFQTRKLIRLTAGDQVLATHGDGALLRNAGALYWFRVGGVRTRLADAAGDDEAVRPSETLALVRGSLIDLTSGKRIATVADHALWATRTGKALVPRAAATAHSVALGPLRWVDRPTVK